ncbi:hypothetical protein ABZP36_026236 [Zizania latifolia]
MARDDQLLGGFLLLLLLFVLPSQLHGRCLAHAAAVDDDDDLDVTTAAAGRRLLQALAAAVQRAPQSVQVKETARPQSMEGRRGPAMLAAVSKHQVPSGANPDSN